MDSWRNSSFHGKHSAQQYWAGESDDPSFDGEDPSQQYTAGDSDDASFDGDDSSQQYWAGKAGGMIASADVSRPFMAYMQTPQPLVPHYPAYPQEMIVPQIIPPQAIVPQRQYAANIQRNYTRSIPMIQFMVNGHNGISLLDALSHNFRGLAQADDRLLQGFGVKVTYRIEWPGYPSFNRQKHALRATREKESVTRAKLAVHVAEVMKDFIEEMAESSTTETCWQVGLGNITLDDLYLLEIHQVAKASLQPVILWRPRVWPCQ